MSGWPKTSCCMGDEEYCACPDMERALRGWVAGKVGVPMTQDQRMRCLSEIGRVEGYEVADYTYATDASLAGGVLSAWTDYARDKGLI